MSTIVLILYTNYKGETATRRIIPGRIWYGSTQWHDSPQWLLDAIDVDKNANRTFAMKDVSLWVDSEDARKRFTANVVMHSDSFQSLMDAFEEVDEALGNGLKEAQCSREFYTWAMMIYETPKQSKQTT